VPVGEILTTIRIIDFGINAQQNIFNFPPAASPERFAQAEKMTTIH
jgi:hypothetical protein